MKLNLEVQVAVAAPGLPTEEQMRHWVAAALQPYRDAAELTVRIAHADEVQRLNADYRQKNKPTNVLSFPMEFPVETGIPMLGDIVVCAEVVAREAQEQGKTAEAHWAHMLVHGTLHLLGFDHITDKQAEEMEGLESRILQNLGFPNPYSG